MTHGGLTVAALFATYAFVAAKTHGVSPGKERREVATRWYVVLRAE